MEAPVPLADPDWVISLQEWCEDTENTVNGLQGFELFRTAAKLYGLARPGNSWSAVHQTLATFSENYSVPHKLGQPAGSYVPPVLLPYELLRERAAARGIEASVFGSTHWELLKQVVDAEDLILEADGPAGHGPAEAASSLVATDPSHPAGCLVAPIAGKQRSYWPARSPDGSAAALHRQHKAVLGSLLLRLGNYTIKSRPQWVGLSDSETHLAVSHSAVGVRLDHLTLEQDELLYEAVETMVPFSVTTLRHQDLVGLTASVEEAFSYVERIPPEARAESYWFLFDETVATDDVASWPTTLVRVDGSSAYTPAFVATHREHRTTDPAHIVTGPTPVRSLSVIMAALNKHGSAAKDTPATLPALPTSDIASIMASVLGSMHNNASAPKDGHGLRSLRPITGLTAGGRSLNPADPSKPISDNLSVAGRIQLLNQAHIKVGEKERKPLLQRFCLRCNLSLLLSIFSGATEAQVLQQLEAGDTQLPDSFWDEVKYSETGGWFCTRCAPISDKGGNCLLVPSAKSLYSCPGAACPCESLISVPTDTLFLSCPYCPITFGVVPVKASELNLKPQRSVKSEELFQNQIRFQYLRQAGGAPKLLYTGGYFGAQRKLAELHADPALAPFPVQIDISHRIMALLPSATFSMDGSAGLHLPDFQMYEAQPRPRLRDLAATIKKGESMDASQWKFRRHDQEDYKTWAAEFAARQAVFWLACIHGSNYENVGDEFMKQYHALVDDLSLRKEYHAAKKAKLLTACLCDFSDQLGQQASDLEHDYRYAFQDSIAPILYTNGRNVLRCLEEPETQGLKYDISKKVHTFKYANERGSKGEEDEATSEGSTHTNQLVEAVVEQVTKKLSQMKMFQDCKELSLGPAAAADGASGEAAESTKDTTSGNKRRRKGGKGKGKDGKGKGDESGSKGEGDEATSEGLTAAQPKSRAPKHLAHNSAALSTEAVALKVGEYHSESPWTPKEKMLSFCPHDGSGKMICPRHQTAAECMREGFPCCFSHTKVAMSFWQPQWHEYFMAHGGHKDLQEQIDAASIYSLMSPEMAASIVALPSEEARSEALLYHLSTRISNISKPAGEHINIDPIQSGKTGHVMHSIWGPSAPFQMASPSGMPVHEFWRAAVGSQDSLVQAVLMDMQEHIHGPGTTKLAIPGMCAVKAPAALATSQKQTSFRAECSPDLILLTQLLKQLLKIPVTLMENNPYSRLTQLFCKSGSLDGVPDSWGVICNPTLLKNFHTLHICQSDDPNSPTDFRYQLNLVHSALRGELWIEHSKAGMLSDWQFDKADSLVFSIPVLVVVVLTRPEGRHSYAARTKMTSLKDWMKWLTNVARHSHNQVIVSRRGNFQEAASHDTPFNHSSTEIHQCRKNLESLLEKCHANIAEVEHPWPKTPTLQATSDELLSKVDNADATCTHKGPLTDDEPTSNGALVQAKHRLLQELHTLQPEACAGATTDHSADTKMNIDESTAAARKQVSTLTEKCQVHKQWAQVYIQNIKPTLDAVPEKDNESMDSALLLAGQFFNKWFLWAVASDRSASAGLQGIVSALRTEWFEDRATEGPDWEDIEKLLKGKIPKGHLLLWKEMVKRGADPVHIGRKRGYRAKPYPADAKILNLAKWDYHALLKAARAIIFDLTDDVVLKLLIEAGVRLGPLVAALKKEAHGQVRVDEWGDLVLRLCNDCTNGNHPEAANSGILSSQHSDQKTTSPDLIAYKITQEEKKHPDSPVRLVKDDIQKAFNLIATLLRKIGLFASCIGRFALINLNLIFGSKASPGGFEVAGDLMVKTLMFSDRIEQKLREGFEKEDENIGVNSAGSTHPAVCRFVDDLVSIIAQHGNRSQDHLDRLRTLITSILGPDAHNLRKQGVEGTAQNNKHTFGSVVDCTDRTMGSCWSKLIKVSDKVKCFVDGEVETLPIGTLQEIRGVLGHSLTWAPGIARIILPRIDSALSQASQAFPNQPTIPKGFIAAPLLRDETDSAKAWKKFRTALTITLLLAKIDKGALFKVSLEAAMPLDLRLLFPGKETPNSFVQFVMDASGEGFFCFDWRTGRYIWDKYTKAENSFFNAFENDLHDLTTINHRELLTELFAGVALGAQHAGKIIGMANDNCCAESLTRTSRARTSKDEQIVAMLGLLEVLLQITFVGERVGTLDNPADWFTRTPEYAHAAEFLAWYTSVTGIETQHVELVGDLAWLREVGWDGVVDGDCAPWFELAVKALDWITEHHQSELQQFCRVDPSSLRAALQSASEGEPVGPFPEFDHNFPDLHGPSKEREWIERHSSKDTRMTLYKQYLTSQHSATPSLTLKKLIRKWGLDEEQVTDPMQAINLKLQLDHEAVFDKLAVKNTQYSGEPQHRPEATPKTVDLQLLSDSLGGTRPIMLPDQPLSSGSGYTGQGGADKAAPYVHLSPCCTAENNPTLREHLQRIAPEATHLTDVEQYMTQVKPFSLAHAHFSPHCTAHTGCNVNSQGINDKWIGDSFARIGDLLEHLQVCVATIECVTEVMRCAKGAKMSALDALRLRTPSFHLVVKTVDACRIISPITGEQAAIRHVRCIIFVCHKSDHAEAPEAKLFDIKHPRPSSFQQVLDKANEGEVYSVLPKADHKDFQYEYKKSAQGLAHLGQISNPAKRRGHSNFVNNAISASHGVSAVCTAAGDSLWVAATLNNQAILRKLSHMEKYRLYCARNFTDKEKDEWFHPRSVHGREIIGNMLPQPSKDLMMTQVSLLLYTTTSSGSAPWQSWTTRASASRLEKVEPSKSVKFTKGTKLSDQDTRSKLLPMARKAMDELIWSNEPVSSGRQRLHLPRAAATLPPALFDANKDILQHLFKVDAEMQLTEAKSLQSRMKQWESGAQLMKHWGALPPSANVFHRAKMHAILSVHAATWNVQQMVTSLGPRWAQNVDKLLKRSNRWADELVGQLTWWRDFYPHIQLMKSAFKMQAVCKAWHNEMNTGSAHRRRKQHQAEMQLPGYAHLWTNTLQVMDMHELPAILECENTWVEKKTYSSQVKSAMARSQAQTMTDTTTWLSSLANNQDIISHSDMKIMLHNLNSLALPKMLQLYYSAIVQKSPTTLDVVTDNNTDPTAAKNPFHQDEPTSSGRKRKVVKITPEVDFKVHQKVDDYRLGRKGKKPKTIGAYCAAETHWREVCDQKGWSHYLTPDVPLEERNRRATYYAAFEAEVHKLNARSIRCKFSALRWAHIREWLPNPFEKLETFQEWLKDFEKDGPPVSPSVAIPAALLEFIKALLDLATMSGSAILLAICLGFWFLLRSIEYLADDDGFFDSGRSITFIDVTLRAQGRIIPLKDFELMDEITIKVYSGKNTLHTCTRSLKANPSSPTCVVAAFKNRMRVLLKEKGHLPHDTSSLFEMNDESVLSRANVSEILKSAAVSCGVTSSKVASHSLRRGGASQYAATPGISENDIARFGRWTSAGYKVYVMAHADMMDTSHANPGLVVPRFERN